VAIDPFVIYGELENLTTFGPAIDRRQKLADIQQTLAAADFKATLSDDVRLAMWRKYLFICPLSAVTSLARASIGAVRDTEHRDSVRQQIMDGPGQGTTSMQRDIQGGRPSELETQLGSLVRLALANKVEAPLATSFYGLLKPQENSARKA